jgi:hypothetical protein
MATEVDMGENAGDIEAIFHATEVGGTVRMRIEKSQLNAEVTNRVSPIMNQPTDSTSRATLLGVTKDASGMWDLESVTGARDSSTVEIVLRRAASDM